MRASSRSILLLLLAPALASRAQDSPTTARPSTSTTASASTTAPPENPLSAHNRLMYSGIKGFLLGSAEKMPADAYSFRPTETVRTFGQIIGHAAEAQYRFCSIVIGEKSPAPQLDATKATKAELVAALKDASAYCDRAYEGLTDATATRLVKAMGMDMPRLGVLTVNNLHSVEHYGNLVTYLRMKGLVPPSSEPGGTAPPKK